MSRCRRRAFSRPILRGAIAVAALLRAAGPVSAQQEPPYATFDAVPYTYAQEPSRFRNLFQTQARVGTVRVAWIGDSQETSPGGAGAAYVPRLGYEFFLRYDNVPETQLATPSVFHSRTSPGAEFLLQGSTLDSQPARHSAAQLPPGLASAGFRTRDVHTYPYLSQLVHDGQGTGAALRPQAYFKTGYRPAGDGPAAHPHGAVSAQVFAFAQPAGSGEVRWEAQPLAGGAAPSFTEYSATGVTTMGLSGGSGVRSETVTLPFTAGKPYQQVMMYGTSNSVATDVLGVRFRSTVDTRGVAVQDLAAGGYRTASYLQLHRDSGPVFAALDFDAAVLHFGANDAAQGVTAEQFRADQQALVDAVRAWAGDPQFKVILAGDPYRRELSPAQQAEYDRYAGAQKSIADADPNVMVLNGRRLTHDIGWHPGAEAGRWLGDAVHYTAAGSKALAAREVAALMGQSTLPADSDLSGRVDSSDFVRLASNFGRSGREWHEGDANYDGTVDASDFTLLAGNFGRTSAGGVAVVSDADREALFAFASAHGLPPPVLPEPASAAVLLGTPALLLRRPRKR